MIGSNLAVLSLAVQRGVRGVLAMGALTALSFGCGNPSPWVPLRAQPAFDARATLVWVGRGECERFEDGGWVRRPEFDYEFSVEQRRGTSVWESVKSLRRLHPNYDGSAGERTQTYYFEIRYDDSFGPSSGRIESSLGDGEVRTDAEFRNATIEIVADVSALAPFDRYHITQRYFYEEGKLEELVELTQGAQPWARNREVATLYGPVSPGETTGKKP